MYNRLELARVSIAYGEQMVVRNVNLQLEEKRIGCLLGPGGCGKTSLLRAIAGFQPVAHGAIHIDGARVCSRKSSIPPELRGIGVVFQENALFPHLTVGQNVAFGLHRLGRKKADKRMIETLGMFGLLELERRYPHQLSTVQQQCVALARAIAPRPRLLLIDEPFSNLDPELRERLAVDVRNILKEMGLTAMLFTHDHHEAFAMADEIGVMAAGRLLQWGDAETLYQRPANRFVANFVGQGSILEVKVVQGQVLLTEMGVLQISGDGNVSLQGRRRLEILVRPNQVLLQALDESHAPKGNAIVVSKAYRGMDSLYTLRLASGTEVLALAPAEVRFGLGEKVLAKLKPHQPAILHLGD